jgi:hypothetical protein
MGASRWMTSLTVVAIAAVAIAVVKLPSETTVVFMGSQTNSFGKILKLQPSSWSNARRHVSATTEQRSLVARAQISGERLGERQEPTRQSFSERTRIYRCGLNDEVDRGRRHRR